MITIFHSLSFVNAALLVMQIYSGMTGWGNHQLMGLGVSLYGCLLHSLVITYFIGTGRSIKDAVENDGLHQDFYNRSRDWYRSKTYPLTGLCICCFISTAIIGAWSDSYREYPDSLGRVLHPVVGWITVMINTLIYFGQRDRILANSALILEANEVLHDADRKNDAPKLVAPSQLKEKIPLGFWIGRWLIYGGVAVWLPFITLRYIVEKQYSHLGIEGFLVAYIVLTAVGLFLTRVVFHPQKWVVLEESGS
ncbi:MAG: hypothetical protein O3B01_22885 [Planctomycetota bacterium]|nr:hypothetical protein [Planctomycetota bacterium]MDA1141417.1 hypothetical protein [Planctomycetota bacterium]